MVTAHRLALRSILERYAERAQDADADLLREVREVLATLAPTA